MRWCSSVGLAVVTGMLIAPAAQAFPPTVSARAFVDSIAPRTSALDSEPFTISYRAHAEVRGAAACDSWTIDVDGPAGGTYRRTGGAVQDIPVQAPLTAGQAVAITVTAACTIGDDTESGTSETTYATAPGGTATPLPVGQSTPAEQTHVDPATVADLHGLAAASAQLALLSCPANRAAARRQARRHVSGLLADICATSAWDALEGGTLDTRGGGRLAGGALPAQVAPRVKRPGRREICHGIRSRNRCTARRRAIAVAVAAERTLTGAADAYARTTSMLAATYPDETEAAPLAAGAVYYGQGLAAALSAGGRARAGLLPRLRSLPALRGRGLAQALGAFRSGASLPRGVRTAFGRDLKSDAAAALALVGRPTRLTFAAALRAPLPTAGRDAALPTPRGPELVAIVPGLGSPAPPPALSAFEADLAARDATCDLTQRAADSAQALAALAGYQGPLAAFIHWLAARSTPPAETTPLGCAPPVVPKLGVPGISFGSFGTGPGQFDRPTDIAVNANGIYVADQGNSRIEHFTADGQFLGAWGGRPLGDGPLADGQFITPVGVALDAAGDVYVTDFLGERVQKFTADGRFLLKWGSEGSGDGQFFRMAGIAVGPNGHVYVVDPGNGRIQVFDQNGAFLSKFGAPGTGPGQFSTGRGLAIDRHGTLYLADRNTGRVEEFAADGSFVREFGERGTDPGTFNGIYDIAVDGGGNLWIADLYNYWLQQFTPEGQFLGVVDTFGAGEEFNPFAVATDTAGHVYLADIEGSTGDRILVLDDPG